jgi:hypothetical protein
MSMELSRWILLLMELFTTETISPRAQFLMNKPPEIPSNPIMHVAADEGKSKEVDTKLYNK